MTLAQTDILERASKLYRKYGIRSITMNDIAHELGISKKTLYQHITDKEALIDLVLETDFFRLEEILDGVIDKCSQPIEQFIQIQNTILNIFVERSNAVRFELKKYYPEKYRSFFDKYMSLFIKVLEENISNGIELGVYRENLDTSVVVRTYLIHLIGMPENELIPLNEYLSEKFTAEFLKYHLSAVVSKKYIDTIESYLKTNKPV